MPKQKVTNSLTVGELIEELQQHDPNLPVVFSYPSGDYWRTQLAGGISQAEEGNIKYTDYHRMNQVCDMDKEQDESEVTNALILS